MSGWWRKRRRRLPVAAVALLAVAVAGVSVAGAGPSTIVVGGRSPESVDVSGSRVVYADRRDGGAGIFVYDALDESTTRITDPSMAALQPSVSGNLVAYAGWSGGYSDIYLYDAASGSTRVISSALDNQVSPSVSSRWVVWEDHQTTYSSQIWAHDLTAGTSFKVDSGYNLPKRRPRVAGDLVVWQDYAGQPNGRFDSDVKAYDLVAKSFITVANSTSSELAPETDGRYIVWAEQGADGDLNIRAYDSVARTYSDICTESGEQTYPVIDGGVVYWVDAGHGTPHIDSRPVAGGAVAPFETYATGSVTALAADSGIAWLQKDGGRWRVRASLTGGGPLAALARIVEPLASWRPALLARISAHDDGSAPRVVSTSVEAGERKVADRSFTAYFSEALDADSVSASSVELVSEATGKLVPARVTYSALAKSVTVVPEDALDGTYRITWGSSLTDVAGNALPKPEEVTFSTGIKLAELNAPTVPQKIVARPVGLTQVEVTWEASTDSGSGVKEYRVFRNQYPGAAPVQVAVVTAPGTTALIAESGDAARKYTQLYSVRAVDNDNNISAYSSMGSPDPHGASATGYAIDSCLLCHQVHGAGETPEGTPIGALGAKTAAACYECHGSTPGNNAYGYASTIDQQGILGEDAAISSTGPDLPGGNTIHRTAAMSTGQRECDACHSPHRKPYNEVAGAYDPATSYGKLLKGNTAKTGATYSTDAATFNNNYCFSCHGAGVMTYMNDIAGAQAFDNSAGDHETGFASSAHSASTVLPTAGGNGKLQANCLACHNEHASGGNGLADYRQSNTLAATYNQAGLCFACHSSTSTEGAKSTGSAPFTWWGTARGDVKAEFTRTGGTSSRHPYNVPTGGPVAEAATWTQTLQADFASDTLLYTVAAADDSIELARLSGDDGTLWSDGFESGDFAAWDGDPTYWATTTSDFYEGGQSARGTTNLNGTRRTDYLLKTIDVAGRTNIRLNYAWRTNFTGGTDYFRAEYWNGAAWTQLFNTTTTGTSAWTTRNDTIPNTATQIRFTSSVNATGEYCAVDAVSVTADPIPYTFVNAGSAVTPEIAAAGTLDSWTELTFNGAMPAGSTVFVDVLRGTDDYEIPGLQNLTLGSGPISLAGLPKISYPTLKLRVEMTGDAPVPPSVTEDFNDSSFDTAKWTDAFLGGSSDPDVPPAQNLFTEGFESATPWPPTNFPTLVGQWERTTLWSPELANSVRGGNGGTGATLFSDNFDDNNISDWTVAGFATSNLYSPSGTYSIQGGNTGSDTAVSPVFGPVTGAAQLSFNYRRAGLDTGEYMYVDYSTDGGSTWEPTPIWNLNGGTTNPLDGTATGLVLPDGTNRLRLRIPASSSGEYGYWDDILVVNDPPADTLASRVIDLSAYSNINVSFQWQSAALDADDSMYVDYSTNGGANWANGWSQVGNGGTLTGTDSFPIGSATANTMIRLRVEGAEAGEYGYWDQIAVSGTAAPTNLWPQEQSGVLRLRAEGAAFGGTVDEGEFVYLNPSQGPWIATGDFDLTVNVGSGGAGTAKAGLMVRTGADVNGALAQNAAMAGVYLNGTNAAFQYRANAGGTTAAAQTSAATAPEWLKLERRGNVFTASLSADGIAWTTIGSGTVTGLNTNAVLVGVALTSGANGTYTEATWDGFRVSGVGQPSSVTPSLDDWTIGYMQFPPALAGKLACVNCHNVHMAQKGTAGAIWNTARVSDPDNIKNGAPASVNAFCLKCHDGTAPSTAANNQNTLVPYNPVFTGVTSPFFPGWNKTQSGVDWAGSGHATSRVDRMVPGCDNCHDPHASTQRRLTALTAFNPAGTPAAHINAKRDNTATYAEEKLCYGCHLANRTVSAQTCTGNAGCHPDLDTQTDAYLNVETAFGYTYKHPVATTGRHVDTEDSGGLGAANRHAECVDCHDPHATKPGRHAANSSTGGLVLRGAKGVKPTSWPVDTVTPFTSAWDNWNLDSSDYSIVKFDGETADYEAYLCFKCHSSYTTQLTSVTRNAQTYKPTDVARDFNPSNQSGHNVLGQVWPKTSFNIGGTNYTWSLPTGSWFKAGYSTTSMLTCTNCHEGQGTAAGPHGSSVAYLIDSAYTTAWNSTAASFSSSGGEPPATLICMKCHSNLANLNTGHSEHADRGNEGAYCRFCHTGVPHGWKRPRMIGYTTDPDPYATWRSSGGQTATGNYGMTRISLKSYTPGNWNESDCGAGCDSNRHPLTGTKWP